MNWLYKHTRDLETNSDQWQTKAETTVSSKNKVEREVINANKYAQDVELALTKGEEAFKKEQEELFNKIKVSTVNNEMLRVVETNLRIWLSDQDSTI